MCACIVPYRFINLDLESACYVTNTSEFNPEQRRNVVTGDIYIPSTIYFPREIRVKTRHGKLHVTARLVQEMSKGAARHNIRAFRSAPSDSSANVFDGAVLLQLLSNVSSYPHLGDRNACRSEAFGASDEGIAETAGKADP
jgi:hypothetical protein